MIQGGWASKQLAKNLMGQRSLRIGPFDIAGDPWQWGQIDDDVTWIGTVLGWNGDKNASGEQLWGQTNKILHEALPWGWLNIYSNNAVRGRINRTRHEANHHEGKKTIKDCHEAEELPWGKKKSIIALRQRKFWYCHEAQPQGRIKNPHEVGPQGIRNGFMPHIMGYKFIAYLCPWG
jgi:hypothetical protein